MRNINRVIIAGNMTSDPDYRLLPSETPVATFGLALNRRWKDRNGEQQEETTFVDCEAFGRQAEVLRDYARKGRGLFIEGRLKLDQWQNREGRNRSKIKVIVESFQFTDRPSDADRPTAPQQGEDQPAAPRESADRKNLPVSRSDVEDLLPF